MNVLVLDPADRVSDFGLASRVHAVTGKPGPVCRATQDSTLDGPAGWVLRFGGGVPDIRTRTAPDGLACVALLTSDRFDADAELAILSADFGDWEAHFARLAQARSHGVDVFLSFAGDAPARLNVDPDLTALSRRAGGTPAGLAWYRSAGLFYTAAKQVIRKDARWAGQYTADSVLRELALHDARVAYHGRPWEVHSPVAG